MRDSLPALNTVMEQIEFAHRILTEKQEKALVDPSKKIFEFEIFDRSAPEGDQFLNFLLHIKNEPRNRRLQILLRVTSSEQGAWHWHTLDLQQFEDNQLRVCIVDAASRTETVVDVLRKIKVLFVNSQIYCVYTGAQKDGASCLHFAIDQASYLRKLNADYLYESLSKKSQSGRKNMAMFMTATEENEDSNPAYSFLGINLSSDTLKRFLNSTPCFFLIECVFAYKMPDCLVGLCRDTQDIQNMTTRAKDFWSKVKMPDKDETIEESLKRKHSLQVVSCKTHNNSIYQKVEKWKNYGVFSMTGRMMLTDNTVVVSILNDRFPKLGFVSTMRPGYFVDAVAELDTDEKISTALFLKKSLAFAKITVGTNNKRYLVLQNINVPAIHGGVSRGNQIENFCRKLTLPELTS